MTEAIPADFDVILADRFGVIFAESGTPTPDAAQALADLLRDLGHALVRSREVGVPDTGSGLRAGIGRVERAAVFGDPYQVRAEAIRVAVEVLRAGTDPSSPLGRYRADRGLAELGAWEGQGS